MKSRPTFFFSALVIFALALSTAASVAQSSAPASSTQIPSLSPAQAPSAKTDDAMELVKQGEKLNSEGQFSEELALYQRALQESPKLYQAELDMGVTLDLEGKYQEAMNKVGL